ncbi:MAG: sigma-70 family RNA polymerase sigma factor [Marinilabiliaceae bacterium]|nr:sigma-70 family RNA polymerase sigma factor [Marinilabiliaceae bacterium]
MTAVQFNSRVIDIQPKLMRYAMTLTYNLDDAKDLLQDSIIRALNFRDKFAENTNFNAWMHVIMRNTFINDYRRKARTSKKDTSMDEVPYLSNFHYTRETPEMFMNEGTLRDTIQRLEKELRVPFEMHVYGYKYKEIAEKLDLPIGTVKSRISFARKKLQSMIAN